MASGSAYDLFRAGLALAALIGYAAIFGYGVFEVWAPPPGGVQYSQALLYIATGIGTLVGGVVAVNFGIKQPGTKAASRATFRSTMERLGKFLLGGANLRYALGLIYAGVYFVVGIAAIITWLVHSAEATDLVKNLATTCFAMGLAIITGLLGTPQ